jgi:hypothetical protein
MTVIIVLLTSMKKAEKVQAEAIQDLNALYGVTLEHLTSAAELRFYSMLHTVAYVAASRCIEFRGEPTTKTGTVTADLRQAVTRNQIPQSDMAGGCWEAEPRFLQSIDHLNTKRPSRREAVLFVNEANEPIAFEKQKGSQTTLVLQKHPHFGNLPPGTLVDDYQPSRICKLEKTSSPYLCIASIPNETSNPPTLIRPSAFQFTAEEVEAWEYDPSSALYADNRSELVPYLEECNQLTTEGVTEQIVELAEKFL